LLQNAAKTWIDLEKLSRDLHRPGMSCKNLHRPTRDLERPGMSCKKPGKTWRDPAETCIDLE
jgi:hypothetical protein